MKKLAVFPLPVVLLPGGLLPLKIFETRYLDMVANCLRHHEPFVVAPVLQEDSLNSQLKSIGTTGNITGWNSSTNGTLHILVKGKKKVEIINPNTNTNGLIVSQVKEKVDEDSDPSPRFHHLLDFAESIQDSEIGSSDTNAPSAIFIAYRLAEQHDFNAADKFSILSETTGAKKLELLEKILVERQNSKVRNTLH